MRKWGMLIEDTKSWDEKVGGKNREGFILEGYVTTL
jgi:hypothetical protein